MSTETLVNVETGEVSIRELTDEEVAANIAEIEAVNAARIAAIPRATVGDKELLLTRAVFNTLRDAVLTSAALGDDTVTIVYEGEELLGTLEEARAAMRVFLATK